jgi:hypothetical protein
MIMIPDNSIPTPLPSIFGPNNPYNPAANLPNNYHDLVLYIVSHPVVLASIITICIMIVIYYILKWITRKPKQALL